MLRWLLVVTIALQLTPAIAADLVDVPFVSPVQVAVGLSDPVLGRFESVSGELGPGDSELLQVGPLSVLIEVVGGAVRATLDQALSPQGNLRVAVIGGSLTMPTGGSAAPLIMTFSCHQGGAVTFPEMVGTIGGHYFGPAGAFGRLSSSRATVVVIPGDTISFDGFGLLVGSPCPSATPGIPVDILRYETLPASQAPATFECSDGLDNDGDGTIDLSDKQCKIAADNSESRPAIQ